MWVCVCFTHSLRVMIEMKKYIHLSCTQGCVGAGAYPSSPGWSRGYTSAESSVYHRANTKTQTTNCFMDNLELPISLMCAFMEAEYLDRTHTDQRKPCELLIRTELATTLLWGNGTNRCTTMLPWKRAIETAQLSRHRSTDFSQLYGCINTVRLGRL